MGEPIAESPKAA